MEAAVIVVTADFEKTINRQREKITSTTNYILISITYSYVDISRQNNINIELIFNSF